MRGEVVERKDRGNGMKVSVYDEQKNYGGVRKIGLS